MTEEQERLLWLLPCYNPPGLLVGPLPHKKNCFGDWIQDYDHPGVALRIKIAVDFVIDQERYRG